ncbi:MAG TPA: response regulator [Pirellulaceae bacterium]|nr:response regulator [Pirellulaceae bacterium]
MTNDSSSPAEQPSGGTSREIQPHDLEFYSALDRDLHDLKNLLWPAGVQADCASSESSAAVLAEILNRIGGDMHKALKIAARMSDRVQRHLENQSVSQVERKAPAARLAPPAPACPLRILCVDDDLSVRGAVAHLLAHLGHDVESASSGSEAVQLIASRRYDAVLTDIRLPDMDGRGITRKIRALGSTPVIWLAGAEYDGAETSADEPDRPHCILPKPLFLDALRTALDKVVAGGTNSTAAI